MEYHKRSRSTSINTIHSSTAAEMHHRPYQPTLRPSPSFSNLSSHSSPNPSPRHSPLLPSASFSYASEKEVKSQWSSPQPQVRKDATPLICGMPLKYVSLVTLAVQNAALSIVMHQSRVSTSPAKSYSPASAVLLNELFKCFISLVIAYTRIESTASEQFNRRRLSSSRCWANVQTLWHEIFSDDCWKLSIPALLYVVQNSLQFVAISNLPVASFQVIYQMKILTTAAFSVAMLGRRLSPVKWLSLLFLALGVGIVQIQTATSSQNTQHVGVGSAHDSSPHVHIMSPLKGFGAVILACFTSGLAGVYFERELKHSKADLWVRNVQLSLFSLVPAIIPVLYAPVHHTSTGFFDNFFRNFGGWAWATVFIQVFGGLVTALVIKYSDNILKGFATSLSIILSSLASVFLFDFHLSLGFLAGSSTVLAATWMYNQPADKEPAISISVNGVSLNHKPIPSPLVGSPLTSSDPILGDDPSLKKVSPYATPFGSPSISTMSLSQSSVMARASYEHLGDMPGIARYNYPPYGSPYASRPPSAVPSRVPSPAPPRNSTSP